ncbi:hypothetical protein GCM10028895_03440 [Pontibacter rugosus]
MEALYSTKATATGGRNGHITSETGVLDVDVRTPESLGGSKGDYLNPEILLPVVMLLALIMPCS